MMSGELCKMAFDFTQLLQFAGYGIFIVFMFYGSKIQLMTILSQIANKMRRLLILRNNGVNALRVHVQKYVTLTPDQDRQLTVLVDSIAIPPVSNLDPQGLVPKMENIFKTYDRYLKNGLLRIVNKPGVEPISQSDLENLTNSLEVAIELNVFYKVVEHFYKLAKKGGVMMAFMLSAILPQLMEMAEALNTASGHFQSGLPIGDGFGPMVVQRFVKDTPTQDLSNDKETSVYQMEFENRRVFIVKAKGPGGSVGNPGMITQDVIRQTRPSLVVTIDAAMRLESEKTGDVSEGVGVAMGGPGMDRYRIEGALAESGVPVLTVVCKMNMKEAISAMPKEVLDQVDPVYQRVLRMIRENSAPGETVIVVGVGNTMGVQ